MKGLYNFLSTLESSLVLKFFYTRDVPSHMAATYSTIWYQGSHHLPYVLLLSGTAHLNSSLLLIQKSTEQQQHLPRCCSSSHHTRSIINTISCCPMNLYVPISQEAFSKAHSPVIIVMIGMRCQCKAEATKV
jgi:hypothetical protein